MRLVVAVLVGCIAACSAARAADDVEDPPEAPQWGRGPFELRDPFALALLRASPYARSPRTLDPLELEVGARGVWANSYGYGNRDPSDPDVGPVHRFTVDAETRTANVVVRAGLLPRIELGLELTAAEWRGGGVLDGAIMGFHQALGLGTLRRDLRPTNTYSVRGIDPSGRTFSLPGRGVGLGDFVITPRVLVLRGSDDWPAVSLTCMIQLPTASAFLGHASGVAESLCLDVSKRILSLPLVVYAGGAVTYYDQCRTAGLREERLQSMAYLGFEWEIRPWISVVAHFWAESARESSLYRHTNIPFGNRIEYVAAGVKFEPIEDLEIEVGIQENFHDPNVTSDVGLLLNVWWKAF